MSVLGVAQVETISVSTANQVDLTMKVLGLSATYGLFNDQINLTGIDPTITNVTFEAALKQAARDHLVNTRGYTFGLFDSVRLMGNTLL